MSSKIIAFPMKWILGLILLVVVFSACGRVVPDQSSNTSTTTTITLNYGISGTISNYGGSKAKLIISAYKDDIDNDLAATAEALVSLAGITYSITVESPGNYLVFADDYADGSNNEFYPAEEDWIGGFGWNSSESVEAAGNIMGLHNALLANLVSVEVNANNPVRADFPMHKIIYGEPDISGTVSWSGSHSGYLGLLIYDQPSISVDPITLVSYAVTTAESSKAYQISGLANGTYYLAAVLFVGGQRERDPQTGDLLGVYPTGNFDEYEMTALNFNGSELAGINFSLNTTF